MCNYLHLNIKILHFFKSSFSGIGITILKRLFSILIYYVNKLFSIRKVSIIPFSIGNGTPEFSPNIFMLEIYLRLKTFYYSPSHISL